MVTIHAKNAYSLKEKVLGLIGKKVIYPIYFETRFGIHTFGLAQPIDILILDSQGVVVCFKKNMQPNSIFLWNPQFFRVVELPFGTIEKEAISMGKKIKLLLY